MGRVPGYPRPLTRGPAAGVSPGSPIGAPATNAALGPHRPMRQRTGERRETPRARMPSGPPRRPGWLRARVRACVRASCLVLVMLAVCFVPGGPGAAFTPLASAHALPIRSDPPADAVLQAPPSAVRMWFSEDLNPLTSRLVVVDTTNREVDNHDSHVSPTDPREMDASLPLLQAGTYVVAWRTQSAVDGHIVGGSYIFRIKRPDGSVPPVPAVLPSGHVPGGGGVGAPTSGGLDGPTWLQTIGTWLALLFMTFWVGGLIWETWILSPAMEKDADLRAAALASARRFRRMTPWALGLVLLADVLIVLALGAELAGGWSGLVAPPLLGAILFGSKFGTFWWMRQVVAGAALVMAVLEVRGATYAVGWRSPGAERWQRAPVEEPKTLLGWLPWTLAAVRAFPGALARGWRTRGAWGRAQLILGAALLVAFALSGHAAAVAPGELPYALSVDLLHLVGNAAWVGGLLYIAAVLVPALQQLSAGQRVRVLMRGLPHFSALALVTVVLLAATGTLNTTIHLTSIVQFVTTTYGRTLAIKITLFLTMAGVSAYHAFWLRPRLVHAMGQVAEEPVARDQAADPRAGERRSAPRTAEPTIRQAIGPAASATRAYSSADETRDGSAGAPAATGAGQRRLGARPSGTFPSGGAASPSASTVNVRASRLAGALEDWLRREAALGVAILLCVALLAAFAGSLAPTLPAAANPSTTSTRAAYVSTPVTAGGLSVVLRVDPAAFGTNTFTVTVRDANGKPVDGAGVAIVTQMLDMDMGVQTAQLKPAGQPGVYSGQSDLTMAGHWDIIVRVLPPSSSRFQTFDFRLTATY